MNTKHAYALLGLLLGAIVDVLLNLIASGIQGSLGLNNISITGLIILSLLGLLLGYWLGANVNVDIKDEIRNDPNVFKTVTMTRLRALFSFVKLQGKGIHIKDIFVIGSKIEIDTKKNK